MRIHLLLAISLLTACSSTLSPSQQIAKCEQSAYTELGVQSDENSSREYALKKQELVRACAVSAGLRFRGEAFAAYYPTVFEQTFRRYDIWNERPESTKYQRNIAAANAELERQTAIAKTRSEFWE